MGAILKHAILVEGIGNGNVFQNLVNVLDDENIDFYVHWDIKYEKPDIRANFSSVIFIKSRNVKWGGTSLSKLSIQLLQVAYAQQYDFYHIISSQDFVLMNKRIFKLYFLIHDGEQLINFDNNKQQFIHRISTYHFLENINMPRKIKYNIAEISGRIQLLLGINRLKKIGLKNGVGKGEHWVSLTNDFVKYLFQEKNLRIINELTKKTFVSDEMLIQTMLLNAPKKYKVNDSLRYIDWKRGNPYIFKSSDFVEVKSKINLGNYIFIRKVSESLSNKLEEYLDEQ